MSLEIKDLAEHEHKLTEIIEHAEKEREAIRLLISGMRLRGSSSGSNGDRGGQKKESISSGLSSQIEDYNDRWFTVRQMTDRLIQLGFKRRDEANKFRPVISNYLKKLYDQKGLERKNVGSEASPMYEYRKVGDIRLKF